VLDQETYGIKQEDLAYEDVRKTKIQIFLEYKTLTIAFCSRKNM